MWSPYSFAKNDPIRYIDEFGKGLKDKIIILTDAILIPEVQKPTPTMYYIDDKVKFMAGETSMYPVTYYGGVFKDGDGIIAHIVNQVKGWRERCPDGKLSILS